MITHSLTCVFRPPTPAHCNSLKGSNNLRILRQNAISIELLDVPFLTAARPSVYFEPPPQRNNYSIPSCNLPATSRLTPSGLSHDCRHNQRPSRASIPEPKSWPCTPAVIQKVQRASAKISRNLARIPAGPPHLPVLEGYPIITSMRNPSGV